MSHTGFNEPQQMMPEPDDNPPPGFVWSESRGPFTSHNGPFYHAVDEEGFRQGFRVKQYHLNSHGIAHGGLLMTFADGLLATAVWRETRGRSVTMRMTSDLLDMVRPGNDMAGVQEAILTLEVADKAPRFLNEKGARSHVPLLQTELPESVEPAAGDVCEVQGGGSRPPNARCPGK